MLAQDWNSLPPPKQKGNQRQGPEQVALHLVKAA
jgi:hypothetical protein